jgi:hypothetical protein
MFFVDHLYRFSGAHNRFCSINLYFCAARDHKILCSAVLNAIDMVMKSHQLIRYSKGSTPLLVSVWFGYRPT